MQNGAAEFGSHVVSFRRVELPKFGLQLFIDEQQRYQRAADIAVATGYDIVDGGLIWFESHRNSPMVAANVARDNPSITPGARSAFLWIMGKMQETAVSVACARDMANAPMTVI
jgi:hypothetical protein